MFAKSQLQEEGLRKFINWINGELRPFMAAGLIVNPEEPDPRKMITSGTLGLVDTGSAKLIVTADHVWQDFEQKRQHNIESKLVFSGARGHRVLDISDAEIVDRNPKADLAILQLSDPERLEKVGKRYFRVNEWPPRRPVVGEYVVGLGYPGNNKVYTENIVQNRSTTIFLRVGSVTDRDFVLYQDAGERQHLHLQLVRRKLTLGGMSGCPLYIFSWPDIKLSLCGFLYAGGDLDDPIFAAYASFILPDGRLDHGRMPF